MSGGFDEADVSALYEVTRALVSAASTVRGMGEGVDRGYLREDDPQLLAAIEAERVAQAHLEACVQGLDERTALDAALAYARAQVREREAALDASGEERSGGVRRHRIARTLALLDRIDAGEPPIVR